MIINTSPDIGVLEVKCSIDLTGANPVINLTNQTTANTNTSPTPTLNDLEWVLNIYSPTGTPILQSDFTSPWQTGVWTTEQLTNSWPRPFGQIEWSGGDYLIQFQVKDSVGNIYELFKTATICRPTGNTKNTPNTYGVAVLTVETMCDTAQLYVKDTTSKSYRGITGTLASAYLAIDYPRDATGVRPDPFEITSFVTDALIPFTYNGRGYEATYYSTYTYDLGENVFVVIRYAAQVTFDVTCNIDLCPLSCEVKALEDSIQSGRCADIEESQAKLNLITPKLLRAFIAKANPTCGIDLPALIEEIKSIGGFSCDCYGASTGIGTSGIVNNFVFAVNNQGGDVIGSFATTGNNVTLTIKDKSYTFGPSSGASILLVPTTSGTNTDVQLQVNTEDLATEIYNETASNTTLLNLFNSLVINGGFKLQVDGRCVINNGACDYEWGLTGIPNTPNNAILVYVQVNGVNQTVNYAFNTSTLVAFQTYLNTLGLGTYVVTNNGGGSITITSASNSSGVGNFVYATALGDPKKLATITKDCSGFVSYTPDEVVQAIIDYLCELDDSQMVTSQDYTICYIDPATKAETTSVVTAGTSLTDFIIELLERGCDTITYITGLTSGLVDCQAIKANFPASIKVLQENDIILGTKEQECAGILPVELGTRIFELGITNVNFMAAVCAAVAACAGGGVCEPYSVLNLSTVENSPADNQLDIIVTFTHPSAVSNNIRYARTDLGGTLVWSVPVNVLPGGSPYTIANVDDGQYIVGVTPVYSDGRLCAEQVAYTGACGLMSAFAASFDGTDILITYSAPVSVPKVRVVINYPNGGTFSQIYTNGAEIIITPPVGLYGSYTITMQTVCNENTSWFGATTAPAVVVVPVVSILQNEASEDITNPYYGFYKNTSGGANIVFLTGATPLIAGGSQTFSLPDGLYYEIYFETLYPSYTNHSATLVTGTGLYNASVIRTLGANLFLFSNVQILDGCVVTIIDASP